MNYGLVPGERLGEIRACPRFDLAQRAPTYLYVVVEHRYLSVMAAVHNMPDSDEEASALAELVDTIARRIEEKDFPIVRPAELKNTGDVEAAEETLQFVEKVEAVELQSFHDAKWAEFRKTSPANADVSEDVRRAQFAYDTYYPLTVEFFIAKSLEQGAFAHRMADGYFFYLFYQWQV